MLVINEKVLRFQVPMKVAVLVAKRDALQAVVGHQPDLLFRGRRHSLRYNFIKVLLHEFKDEEKAVFLTDDFL